MNEQQKKVFPVWVDWIRRIISFHEAEGFERLEYPSQEEMMSFAVAKGFAGFGIQ